ncbi:hypothetical protein KM043_014882 [Ampulex compressa]|nr:hypothetical protein KM043_014882 [Ampulex compressa]
MQLGKAANTTGAVHMEIPGGGGAAVRRGGGGGARHYLCKGEERSLWNRGAPGRSSLPLCHTKENVGATPACHSAAPAALLFGGRGCFKVSGWCGGVMP